MLGGSEQNGPLAQLLGGKGGKAKGGLLAQLLGGKGEGKSQVLEKLLTGNLDLGEMSQMDPRAASSAKNQEASRGTREQRIARHLEHVKECQQIEKTRRGQQCSNTYSHERKIGTSHSDLRALQPMKISELQVGQVHHGHVLYCRTITPCTLMQSVQTLIEDADGDIADLAVYNAPCIQRLQSAQRYLPNRCSLAIKEPFFKLRADGTVGIRIDDPKDICFDVEAPSLTTDSVEARLAQLHFQDPGAGKKKLREMLQAEGFSISQKRVQDLLASFRHNSDERPGDDQREEPAQDLQSQEHSQTASRSQSCMSLPKRDASAHCVLHSGAVLQFREAGNAAIKAFQYKEAEKAYTKAIKAALQDPGQGRGGTPAEEIQEDGVLLWTLFSNRCAARLHLTRPDEALQDSLVAHRCAPPDAIKPVLRCAEALAALRQDLEVDSILEAAIKDFPGNEDVIRQKQRDLAPKARLHVGPGQPFATIMDAVLKAPSGAEILVAPGVYREPLVLTKPVTIRSINALQPTEHWVQGAPPGEFVQVWVSLNHAISIDVQGSIGLRGLRIICEGPLKQCRHAVEVCGGVASLRNCSLSSASGPIVAADFGARVILEHCAVHDGAQGGLIAARGATLVMSKVFCSRAAASGLELRTDGRAVLESCSLFANGRSGAIIWNGAGSFFAKDTEVHSNNFESGVLIEENVKSAVFNGCKIYGNGHAGVVVQTKGLLVMQECEVHSNLEGILIQSSGTATIDRCEVFKNRSTGVFVGYDHVGRAQITSNKVHGNSKGILLGTGRNEKVIVNGNKEFENNRPPSLELPPGYHSDRGKAQMSMDMREWCKNIKKSGGSAQKAAFASDEINFMDTLLGCGWAGGLEDAVADAHLACSYCKKPPTTQKFLKCSTCLRVSYCSPECQKAHWKACHKAECKEAPPRHPSFIDSNQSVDTMEGGECTIQ